MISPTALFQPQDLLRIFYPPLKSLFFFLLWPIGPRSSTVFFPFFSLNPGVFISISFEFFFPSPSFFRVLLSFGTVNADARSAKLEDLFHVSCKLHSVPAEGGIHHVKWTFSYWSPAEPWPPANILHQPSLYYHHLSLSLFSSAI